MVEEGKVAPKFTVETDEGSKLKLSDLKGQNVVIYFYPKDDTSGCTKEAIQFTELKSAFSKQNTVVLGISPDSIAKHQKFKTKHDLDVLLGADENKKIAESYGVWVEKQMYGKKYMGVERSTFLVDPKGKVAKAWRKVKVPGHAEAVLDAVKELNG